MKAAGIRELKKELLLKSHKELIDIALQMSKFKKENKELLTYLLFEAHNEQAYRDTVKEEIEERFENLKGLSFYHLKKNVRKILRETKKYIRYSKNVETDVELRLFFCKRMIEDVPILRRSSVLTGIVIRELDSIEKKLIKLHEDLQYDFGVMISNLKEQL